MDSRFRQLMSSLGYFGNFCLGINRMNRYCSESIIAEKLPRREEIDDGTQVRQLNFLS
jgi:hypothetical protein